MRNKSWNLPKQNTVGVRIIKKQGVVTVIDHRALRVPSNKNAACGKKIRWERDRLVWTYPFRCSVSILSSAICIPRRNAYVKIASSARLIYSLQQSWNFSKISFCSSVKLFSNSSWCLDMSQEVLSSPLSSFCYPLAVWCCRAIILLICFPLVAPPVSTTQYHITSAKSRVYFNFISVELFEISQSAHFKY